MSKGRDNGRPILGRSQNHLTDPYSSDNSHFRSESSRSSSNRSLSPRPLPPLPTNDSHPAIPKEFKDLNFPSTISSTAPSTPYSHIASQSCPACGKAIQGQFVRALGSVFHLNCFRCIDCGVVVASLFFPIDGTDGKQSPLCERDYFRRLDLICEKCGTALRGSYITACKKKYHVDHFTCAVCPTLFGPQDSYYEHDDKVYCHFHFSTRFATKCSGCNTSIMKQFVEINRNMRDECWHPECYMIHKFWNVRMTPRRYTSALEIEGPVQEAPAHIEEESRETPTSLREEQVQMEQRVDRIWTVLSTFEESSAACISDMLRQVADGVYLDAIRVAEKFILHVEVLFGTIADLEFHFVSLNVRGISHIREARLLCRKTVELFTLLSHTQETGARRMGMTQELLALVTGLAHYLKILIRIALTGALKLEREQSVKYAITSFLDKLHLLAVQGANPSAKRLIKGSNDEHLNTNSHRNLSTQGVIYGFRSLAPEDAGESPFSQAETAGRLSTIPPSDLCVRCGATVEEDCVRLGTYQRWHSHCIQCAECGKAAATIPIAKPSSKSADDADGALQKPKISSAPRPPANVGMFVYDTGSMKDTPPFGLVPTIVLCTEHAHQGCRSGFQPIQRLEQYAYLLNVALRRLYLLLKRQGVVHFSVTVQTSDPSSDPYRNTDLMRMKSVHLDRKLSATARIPKRSTIIESPSGRTAHPSVRPYDAAGAAQQHNNNDLPQPNLPPSSQVNSQGNVSHSAQPNTSSLYSPPQANLTELPDKQDQLRPVQRKDTESEVITSGSDLPLPEFQHITYDSEENHGEANDGPQFSVQSFEPQANGFSRDIIVTVGMREEEALSEPDFRADTPTPSRLARYSAQSTTSLIDEASDPSDGVSEYWSAYETSIMGVISRRGSLNVSIGTGSHRGSFSRRGSLNVSIATESNRDLFSGDVVDGDWDRLSMISRQTFETAQEPPPELLLALGLHLDPIPRQTPLSSDEPSLAQLPVPCFTGGSTSEGQSHGDKSASSGDVKTNSNTQSPQYNISFIRDVSNVCIIGSHINFTTNIMQPDDGVCVGLHTLYLRSDPTALHNSYERQKKVNQQTKAMRSWGSQLLITSSSSLREYPLSVPGIKTRELEEVIKDVFTWLYSALSPHSIMWLYDEFEESSRTSLIGQCLADFLGERRDLTASYFYTKRSPSSQAGTSDSRADRKDNPCSIIPTIAYELTRRIPEIEIPIALTAANDLWVFDLSLDEQMKKLIVDPLQAASDIGKGDSHKFPQLFLIHGLEDCDDDDFQELFLCAFGKSLAVLQQCIPQKLIVLGRRSAHLRECFSKPEMKGIVRHCPLPMSQVAI